MASVAVHRIPVANGSCNSFAFPLDERPPGTEAVWLEGSTVADVKPCDVAHLVHGSLPRFNALMVVRQRLHLGGHEGCKRP